MPLIAEDPPTALPRGQKCARLAVPGQGSESNAQLKDLMKACTPNAPGVSTRTLRPSPPASIKATETPGSSLNRFASTAPAEPAPTITKSNSISISSRAAQGVALLRPQPGCGVEPDGFGVEVGVFDDEGATMGELSHLAQTFRRLDLLHQRRLDALVEGCRHRRQKQARRDRIHTHANGPQLAGRRHVQTDQRCLGSGISALSDLAFECGARRDIDHD